MSKQLKLAFIGGGSNSAVGYVHFTAARLDNNFAVVAGAFSRDPNVNQQTAMQWGIPLNNTYNDWQELIIKGRHLFDAIVLLTPTPHHAEVLKELFQRNIPTICEKALVSGPKEVVEISKFYKPEKNFLAVTFNYSGYAMVRELKHLLKNGKLGDIQKIHLEMPQEGFKRPPDIAGRKSSPQPWRLKDYEVPTICLDLGVHLHHLSSFLLEKEPISTIAQFANHSEYPGLIDDVQMLLRYPGNITGSMWMSKTAIGNRNGLKVRVYGSSGSATWFQLNPDELELNFNDGRREILDRASQCEYAGQFRYNRMKPGHPTGFVEAFANLYQDIHSELLAFLDGKYFESEYVFGLEHALNGLKLFEKSTASVIYGEWQKLDNNL